MGLGSSFLDNLQGLITLKIYQDDAYKAKAMDEEAEHFRKITMKVLTMQLNSVSLMDLLAYGGAAIGILTALLQFQADQLTVLGVILFILLSSEFFIPLRLLGSFFHVAMNGKAASDKIFTLLDTPVETQTQAVDFAAKKCYSGGYSRSAFCLQRREACDCWLGFKHLTKSAYGLCG